MTENVAAVQASQKMARPPGVWILTIYALLFAGLAPLFLSVFLLISGNAAGSVLGLLFSLLVSIAVIASAIGAWKGSEKARKTLLVFVTLQYVLVALNNFVLLNSGQIPEEEQTRFLGRVLRGFLYPAVYLWYFNRDTTKEFYN